MKRGCWSPLLVVSVLLGCSADRLADKGYEALHDHQLPVAEDHFRRALSKEPRHPRALAGLGWTYSLAGERAAAFGAFDRCAQVAPSSPGCLRGLASMALSGGEGQRAGELLREAEAAAPDDPKVQVSLGLLELATGKVDEGAARFEALVARLPEDGEYRLGLAEARLRQGRVEDALAEVERGLADDDAPRRSRALLLQLQARTLVRSSGGREDPARCEETAPPVRAWLDAAEQSLDAAASTGVALPDLPSVRRLVARRRGVVDEACPQSPAPVGPGEDPKPR